MSGVYIPGMKMPRRREEVFLFAVDSDGKVCGWNSEELLSIKAIAIPDHGRLIDADALRRAMYHEAFETDTPMQKWDSGCWIRYKMFEWMEEAAPTIIPASETESEVDRDS